MDVDTVISAVSLFVAIIVALLGDAGFISFANRPNVKYICTHILRSGNEYTQGLLILNRGKSFSRSIKIKLVYDNCIISDIQIDDEMFLGKPVIKEGGNGSNYVIVDLDNLPPKKQGSLYITTNGKNAPIINGVYDTNRELVEEDFSYKRPLSDSVAIILGLFALFWMLLGIIF